jgi:hypothetical protein
VFWDVTPCESVNVLKDYQGQTVKVLEREDEEVMIFRKVFTSLHGVTSQKT